MGGAPGEIGDEALRDDQHRLGIAPLHQRHEIGTGGQIRGAIEVAGRDEGVDELAADARLVVRPRWPASRASRRS
ncbi:MAG: hypothetical protein U0610_08710 [bacterium]